MIDRIDAADPDALTLLAWVLICAAPIVVYLIAERMLRRNWPQGHGKSYFWQPSRKTDTE